MADIVIYGKIKAGTSDGIVGNSAEHSETNYGNVQAAITAILQNFENFYTKTQTYTKAEVNALVAAGLKLEPVQTLPTTDIDTHTIYLVPKSTPTTDNAKDEYVYVNGGWEKIGDTEIDLTNYVTIQTLNSALAGKVSIISNPVQDTKYVLVNNQWVALVLTAALTAYNNAQSSLQATTVQAAIDELLAKFGSINDSDVLFSPTGIFSQSSNDVRDALLELANFITGIFVNDTDPLNPVIEEDEEDNGLLPLDGNNYNIGSVSGLGISSNVDAMKIGCTIVFTASTDFPVGLPYSYVDL